MVQVLEIDKVNSEISNQCMQEVENISENSSIKSSNLVTDSSITKIIDSKYSLKDNKDYFKAFNCDICNEPVYFPLCKNIDSDYYEKLAWCIYSDIINMGNCVIKSKKLHCCFSCKLLIDRYKKNHRKLI